MSKNHVKREREQLLAEIRSLPPGEQALKKLAYLRETYDLAIPGYVNALTILSDTMYQSRKHFLLELIQNADDAPFESDHAELKFVIREDSLELLYNETGFELNDVLAITETGESTKASRKNAKTFIGEKGIGFKSVFALASNVEIESAPWHFRLTKESVVVPEAMRNGTLQQGDGTRMKVSFIDQSTVRIVSDELHQFVGGQVESFLFLQNLSSFQVEDHRVSPVRKKGLALEPADRSGDTLRLTTSAGEIREYLQYGEDLEFSAALVAERWERLAANAKSLKRRMTVAVLVDKNDNTKLGRLYCYLPTEVRLPIPIFLQVDGHTKADRESLHDIENNRWNLHLLSNLPDFLVSAVLEWRKHPAISEFLYRYIPVNEGTNQLAPVIKKMMQKLRHEEWVLTFDKGRNGWVRPDKAIVASDYLVRWFENRPGFRRRVEELLGKKFVHPEWVKHVGWSALENEYRIEKIDSRQFAMILQHVKLPSEMTSDESNLLDLYDRMSRCLANSRYVNLEEVREHLLRAPVFPIDRKFGPLLTDDKDSKAYWVSARSRRETGLEEAVNIRVVDIKYTYRIDLNKEATPEKIAESRRINERNEVVRELLRTLKVSELNDDNLLVELQIPWLSSEERYTDRDLSVSYNVMFSIFDAFRAKRLYEEGYLKLLSLLKEAVFEGNRGGRDNLSQLLLPEKLRLQPEDLLFEQSGLEELMIPSEWLEPPASKSQKVQRDKEEERKRKWLEDLRRFLIACGINAAPKFVDFRYAYADANNFSRKDPVRYEDWKKRVGNETTDHNRLVVETIELDVATRTVLLSGQYDRLLMSAAFYQAWLDQYGGVKGLFETNTLHYGLTPPVGFYKVSYKRFEDRSVLISDRPWFSKWSHVILLMSIKGDSIPLHKALRFSGTGRVKLIKSSELLPLVLETTDRGKGYHTDFLDSFNVHHLTVSHINELWKKVEPHEHEELLEAIIELKKAGFDTTNLKLLDKTSNSFRDAVEFRLGQGLREGVPSIEEQYGEQGRILGELLQLNVESEVTYFIDALREHLFGKQLDDSSEDNILEEEVYKLFTRWGQWGQERRREFIGKFQLLLEEIQSDAPVLILDGKKVRSVKKAGYRVIALKIKSAEKQVIQDAAREIGFRFLSEMGEWKLEGEQGLDQVDKRRISQLAAQYAQQLEPHEKSRMMSKLSRFQDITSWGERIKKAATASRMIEGVSETLVELPFLDQHENLLLVGLAATPQEMLARLFSLSDFTTYKSAKWELDRIAAMLSKQPTKPEKTVPLQAELPKPTEQERSKPQVADKATIASEIFNSLRDERPAPEVPEGKEWKVGIDPNQEQELIEHLGSSLNKSLEAGLQWKEKQTREPRQRRPSLGTETGRWYDAETPDPKEFLMQEYQGKCQLCAHELNLSNGRKWFEVYHLHESKGEVYWSDRPFNILCLCPNCHALAKHGGGRDFEPIRKLAEERFKEEAVPVEMPSYKGDYYLTTVMVNGNEQNLVVSKVHLAYFVSVLKEHFAEVGATTEEL